MHDSEASFPSHACAVDTLARSYGHDLTEIGQYELVRVLGAGGMSKVYLGRNRCNDALVAVKILRPELIEKRHILKRFHTEFRSSRKLFHPHLVRALDFGMDQGMAYLVLEYINGPSLAELLQQKTRYQEAEAVRIILQVASGLQVAHQMQIVHRDIKPGNILIDGDGNAKLSDLGLAKDLLAEEELTRTGASLGTLAYMAPEQFQNARQADPRSDIYSLGITLYHMVTGRLPFSGGQMTMLQKKLANQYVPPRDLAPELSSGINLAIRQFMHPLPDNRPATCGEFIRLLESTTQRLEPTQVCLTLPSMVDNRRIDERFPTSLQSSCSPLLGTKKDSWKGEVLDLSHGGAQILVTRRFETGMVLSVEVEDSHMDDPATFLLRICWVKPGKQPGQWLIGGKFHRRFRPSELQRLLHRELHTVVLHES